MLVCDRAVSMTITVKKRHKSAASNWKQQSDNLRAKLEAQDDRAQALTSQVMYVCTIRLRSADDVRVERHVVHFPLLQEFSYYHFYLQAFPTCLQPVYRLPFLFPPFLSLPTRYVCRSRTWRTRAPNMPNKSSKCSPVWWCRCPPWRRVKRRCCLSANTSMSWMNRYTRPEPEH